MLSDHSDLFYKSLLNDLSEGVMSIDFEGTIRTMNPECERLLNKSAKDLIGQNFALCFFKSKNNDAFNQLVLDAVYDTEHTHKDIVSYDTGSSVIQLRLTTSFLKQNNQTIGIIIVMDDISELLELRDAVKAMRHIKELNTKLEMRNRLISDTFGRYLSDDIVRELLNTSHGLTMGGTKHTLSILMSDLRGFTAMSELMPPQDLINMLNHYLGCMTDIIQKHHGTIIEFIGDGILAIFGAPNPLENHADEAVCAAVEMQSMMPDINKWNTDNNYKTLEMGIGINTGDVIIGNIGSEKRAKYGVVGSHVNLCGRIESYTVGGQVLVSPSTVALLTLPVEIEQMIEIYPKGISIPIFLSHVTGIGEYRCPDSEIDIEPLPSPVPVTYTLLQGKHGEKGIHSSRVFALSDDNALMEKDPCLQLFTNLCIQIEGGLFAKVISVDKGITLIRFTSKPPSFEKWKNSCFHPQKG